MRRLCQKLQITKIQTPASSPNFASRATPAVFKPSLKTPGPENKNHPRCAARYQSLRRDAIAEKTNKDRAVKTANSRSPWQLIQYSDAG